MANIINGKELAIKIRQDIKQKISKLDTMPGLAVILVGNDPASHIYVGLKERACQAVGINFEKHLYFATEPQEKIINKIEELNKREDINGILVQLPLPAGFDANQVIAAIDPKKDVDGFHQENIRRFMNDQPSIVSGLVTGVWRLIENTGQDVSNMSAAVVAKSGLCADPIVKILANHGAKAEFVNADTPGLADKLVGKDILVVAVGHANFITAEMVKPGTIIIDIGTNRVDDQVVGDVDFQAVKDIAGYITPVPGGVGPMTVAMLLENVLHCYNLNK